MDGSTYPFVNKVATSVPPTSLSFSAMTGEFTIEALASHIATVASIDIYQRIPMELLNIAASGSLLIFQDSISLQLEK